MRIIKISIFALLFAATPAFSVTITDACRWLGAIFGFVDEPPTLQASRANLNEKLAIWRSKGKSAKGREQARILADSLQAAKIVFQLQGTTTSGITAEPGDASIKSPVAALRIEPDQTSAWASLLVDSRNIWE